MRILFGISIGLALLITILLTACGKCPDEANHPEWADSFFISTPTRLHFDYQQAGQWVFVNTENDTLILQQTEHNFNWMPSFSSCEGSQFVDGQQEQMRIEMHGLNRVFFRMDVSNSDNGEQVDFSSASRLLLNVAPDYSMVQTIPMDSTPELTQNLQPGYCITNTVVPVFTDSQVVALICGPLVADSLGRLDSLAFSPNIGLVGFWLNGSKYTLAAFLP